MGWLLLLFALTLLYSFSVIFTFYEYICGRETRGKLSIQVLIWVLWCTMFYHNYLRLLHPDIFG